MNICHWWERDLGHFAQQRGVARALRATGGTYGQTIDHGMRTTPDRGSDLAPSTQFAVEGSATLSQEPDACSGNARWRCQRVGSSKGDRSWEAHDNEEPSQERRGGQSRGSVGRQPAPSQPTRQSNNDQTTNTVETAAMKDMVIKIFQDEGVASRWGIADSALRAMGDTTTML
jgi:hypothetical protein